MWTQLAEPMPAEAIEWRVQTADKDGRWALVVPYANARWLQQRLDDVVGPGNWEDHYEPGPNGGVLCALTIRFLDEEGDWRRVVKQDAADNTGIEGTKGGVTDAFKRACCKFNVGGMRALYETGECWGVIKAKGSRRDCSGKASHVSETKSGSRTFIAWDPPPEAVRIITSGGQIRLNATVGEAPVGEKQAEANGVYDVRTGEWRADVHPRLPEALLDLQKAKSEKALERALANYGQHFRDESSSAKAFSVAYRIAQINVEGGDDEAERRRAMLQDETNHAGLKLIGDVLRVAQGGDYS